MLTQISRKLVNGELLLMLVTLDTSVEDMDPCPEDDRPLEPEMDDPEELPLLMWLGDWRSPVGVSVCRFDGLCMTGGQPVGDCSMPDILIIVAWSLILKSA